MVHRLDLTDNRRKASQQGICGDVLAQNGANLCDVIYLNASQIRVVCRWHWQPSCHSRKTWIWIFIWLTILPFTFIFWCQSPSEWESRIVEPAECCWGTTNDESFYKLFYLQTAVICRDAFNVTLIRALGVSEHHYGAVVPPFLLEKLPVITIYAMGSKVVGEGGIWSSSCTIE